MPSTPAASSGADPDGDNRFADSEDDEQAVALGPVGRAVDAPVALSRGEVDAAPVHDEGAGEEQSLQLPPKKRTPAMSRMARPQSDPMRSRAAGAARHRRALPARTRSGARTARAIGRRRPVRAVRRGPPR